MNQGYVFAPYITVQQIDSTFSPKMTRSRYQTAQINSNHFQPIKTRRDFRIEKIEKFLEIKK